MRQPYTGANSEVITVSNTAIPLTTIPSGAHAAHITVHEQRVRYLYDGSTPTASFGHSGIVDEKIDLENRQKLTGFRIIREGGTDAKITVTYHLKFYPDEAIQD